MIVNEILEHNNNVNITPRSSLAPHPSSLPDYQLLDPTPSLTPILDPHLSTVRLFWYLFWLCLAEITYLGLMVANYAWVTPEFVKHQSAKTEYLLPSLSLLYFLPPSLVLLGAIITFLSKRYSYGTRKFLMGIVILALLGGIAGAGYAFYNYIRAYNEYRCKDYEFWSVGLVPTVYAVLVVSPLLFRFAFIVALHHDIKNYEYGRSSDRVSAFAVVPDVGMWIRVIYTFDFLVCCIPRWNRSTNTTHTRHRVQHMVQLVLELVLLAISIVEQRYLQLFPIVAGLLGLLFGLLRLHMLDVILNMFAFVGGLFLIGNNVTVIRCKDPIGWMYLALFCGAASLVRAKSLVHACVSARAQLYNWILAQLLWVISIGSTSESADYDSPHGFVRFYEIRNFLKLRSFSDDLRNTAHGKGKSEKQLLLPKKPSSKMKKTFVPLLVLLITFLGFCIIISFAGLMGAIYPQYKGGPQVLDIETWDSDVCTLLYYDALYKDYTHALYYYFVSTSTGADIIAIPIQTRFSDPLNRDHFNEKYQEQLWQHASIPCHIPPNVLLANDTVHSKFDYDRKSPVWNRVAILGSDPTLADFRANYLLWLSLPPIMIGFGVILFIAGIFSLRHLLRGAADVKLKRTIH